MDSDKSLICALMAQPPPGPPPAPKRLAADVAAAGAYADQMHATCEKTLARAAEFTEDQLQSGVDGEWSTVQSLRHLVFVADLWLSRTILGEADPFHPIGLPPHFVPAKLPGTSIDPDAQPTFAEASEVLRGRLAHVESSVAALDDADLARPIDNHAGNVAGALGVLFDEYAAHDSFINRDLDKIR